MYKFLVLLVFLSVFPLFLIDVLGLEVEFQTESERAFEALGWLDPEIFSLQEQYQILVDTENQRNRISIGLQSSDPDDIRFPDNLEDLKFNQDIHSFTITNQFGCAPTEIDRACIIVEIAKSGLGENLIEIRENARKITDKLMDGGVILFAPEFYAITIDKKTTFDGSEEKFVVEAIYTTNKQPTNELFTALATTLISAEIRNGGGFYDHAKKLSEHTFSDFSITLSPQEDNMIRSIHISLTCSNVLPELPRCDPDGDIRNQLDQGNVNVLDLIQAENLSRSQIFVDEFLPLNSIIHLIIFSDSDLQIKSVHSSIIERLYNIGDVQNSGWVFMSKSGKKIDARYIFGPEQSVSKSELSLSIGPNTGEPIEIKEPIEIGGGCLIATATFGSEMTPQVQFLREIRDNTVLQTESGTSFMTGFNHFYYSFSPTIADYERQNPAFKEAVKITLTPLLISLTLLQYPDINSELEVLGYGIGIILLNIGMYFVIPAILILKIKKLI